MRLILSYIKKHMGIFMLSMTFLTMEAMADLLQPMFMSYIVDRGIKESSVQKILVYGAIMFGIALLGAFSAIMRNLFASTTSQAIGKELRRDMYRSVQELSLENIDHLKPSSIITRITNDVTQVQDFVNGIMRIMVKAPITCVGAIILIILQTPKQAPIMFVILVIAGVLIVANMKVGYPRFGKVQDRLDRLNNVSREFLSAIRVVKAFHAEEEETQKFDVTSKDLADANLSALRAMAIFFPLINLTVNMGIVLLLWVSRNQNAGEIGKLMASVNYMTQVLFAVGMISNVLNMSVRALASSERIKEVLCEKPAQKKTEHPLTPNIQGRITFDQVSFAYYGAGKNTLSDLNIEIEAGQTIGIIGPTGSGKTTMISLVPRFYDSTAGTIKIDGADVTQIDEKTLREAVAVVPQKALLFSGSIRENLMWGSKTATEEDISRAADIACATEFIQKTEKGWDSILGQGGVNLSGGQKQRLSLARALVRKPKILILDDCTSALDAETEAKVLSGLHRQSGSMTILLISQRISTVRRADRILCLDQGVCQGYGTHEELMATCEIYRTIYESQIGGVCHG